MGGQVSRIAAPPCIIAEFDNACAQEFNSLPMNNNLYSRFRQQGWSAQQIFIHTVQEQRLTYDDMDACSAQLAHALRDWRVQPGDRVLVQVEKNTEALLYLACLSAGAIYVPLNSADTLAELEYFINDADPTLLAESHRLWRERIGRGRSAITGRQCAYRAS